MALVLVLSVATLLSGCGKDDTTDTQTDPVVNTGTEDTTETGGDTATIEPQVPDTANYIKLALYVLYNDSDANYYSSEHGTPIYVTEDGQYTLSFDIAEDLSSDGLAAGISAIEKLTAVYIYDMGAAEENQSPLQAANITYDSVVVDGTELTITNPGPKSAFKSNGLFDTNDPINSWDGSAVEEVETVGEHVVSLTLSKPQTISVTFTLSDMSWTGTEASAEGESTAVSTGANDAVFSTMDFTNMTALELTKYLGNGINLGNTMEATNASKNLSATTYETSWGQPVTTAAMVQGMKDCGFDTIRIPVAWTSVMDYQNGDYEINEDFIARVEEIVNYALDAEMFVVVNDHWDYGWWAMFGSSNQEDVEMAWKVYEEMWTQIATRFADYGDMLIFESANEELGDGLNNNSSWAASGSLSENEKYEMANAINQKFVDIVRSCGGNNDDRFLLIAGISTDIDKTCDSRFVMPTDTADSKLFLSVHYYTPWGYCGDNDTGVYSKWGIKEDFTTMESYVSKLTKFTDAGYGVIIGEWGALPVYDTATGGSYLKDNTATYTKYFLDLCDLYNLCPVLWSTNNFYNKTTLTMIDEEITEIFASRSYSKEAAAGDGYTDTVKSEMAALVEAAPDVFETDGETYGSTDSVAYIMWNGGAGSYNVGDTYTPSDCPSTIVPHDVIVDGAGTYTVSLEFPGGNDGLTFGALALNAGEQNYPGCILDITSVIVTDADGNETELTLLALPYTSSDDGKCTRVNLINQWVSKVPDDARNKQNLLSAASPVILDAQDLVGIYSITITFDLLTK